MFGYFPCYTIGSLYAAQLMEAYGREHRLEAEVQEGNFAGLLSWLREKVHRQGAMWPAEELITRVTGKGLDAAAFFRHCERAVQGLK
jgi:carboxypeptidase Taq